ASGLSSAMDGGSFGSFASGFISGGASAMFMSDAMKGLSPDDLTDYQRTSLGALAASIGGAASIIAGGSYLRGALIGYQIAMFNYLEGEDPVVFFDEEGNKVRELQDVIVVGMALKHKSLDYMELSKLLINGASNTNTCFDSFGRSLIVHGANSTLGINKLSGKMKFYWKTLEQRPFNGNKYVSTQKLTTIGSNITSKTRIANPAIFTALFAFSVYQDIQDYQNEGRTNYYHAVRATVSFGAACAGMEVGLYWGGVIGAGFGGFGAIPGSIIGATIGGIIGAIGVGEIGGLAVDRAYGKW
ncbi:MAG: hypothetical protein K2L00_07490, partial [Muribaculaceae bacterium]|nr:hypothetical protein [Muribaculaceae bacterium]